MATKIMIVDDEIQITSMLEKSLSRNKDFSLSIFNNPVTAVSQVNVIKPDVILLDIMMPQMDGLEALNKIKAVNKDVKIIIMTAYSTLDRVLKSHKEGAVKFILKPFESLKDVENQILEIMKA